MDRNKKLITIVVFPALLLLAAAAVLFYLLILATGIFCGVAGIIIGIKILKSLLLTSLILFGYSLIIIGICIITVPFMIKFIKKVFPLITGKIGSVMKP